MTFLVNSQVMLLLVPLPLSYKIEETGLMQDKEMKRIFNITKKGGLRWKQCVYKL